MEIGNWGMQMLKSGCLQKEDTNILPLFSKMQSHFEQIHGCVIVLLLFLKIRVNKNMYKILVTKICPNFNLLNFCCVFCYLRTFIWHLSVWQVLLFSGSNNYRRSTMPSLSFRFPLTGFENDITRFIKFFVSDDSNSPFYIFC